MKTNIREQKEKCVRNFRAFTVHITSFKNKSLKKRAKYLIRPIIEIPVFRVTWPYLNLLVKPRIFKVFWGKNNFMHFER